jgi:hypothetical protein
MLFEQLAIPFGGFLVEVLTSCLGFLFQLLTSDGEMASPVATATGPL